MSWEPAVTLRLLLILDTEECVWGRFSAHILRICLGRDIHRILLSGVLQTADKKSRTDLPFPSSLLE